MDLERTGRRALVTGSSAGVGAAIAALLAAEGTRVVVHGRDAGRAVAVADGIRRTIGGYEQWDGPPAGPHPDHEPVQAARPPA